MNKISSSEHSDSRHERAQLRKDTLFVSGLSLVLLGAMVALYFWDQATGLVSESFAGLIRF